MCLDLLTWLNHTVPLPDFKVSGLRPSVALKDNGMRIDQCDPEYLTNYTSRWSDVSIQRLPSQ